MTTSAPARIRPSSTVEVVEAVRDLADAHQSIAVWGSGSEFVDVPAPQTDVVVEMCELTGIVDHQPDDLTVTVRAGTTVEEMAGVIGAVGQTAVLPEWGRARTLGGTVGAGRSGFRRLRYGPTRDRVIGIELVTGYGQAVRGGGRLVKNVTGYDLARLATGSRGALGIVTEVTFKLWPKPPASATVAVSDAAAALASVYRPSAVLETPRGSFVYLEGPPSRLEAERRAVGGEARDGLQWPDPLDDAVVLSVRVPPRNVAQATTAAERWGASTWIAQHGVGIVDVGMPRSDSTDLDEMRGEIGAMEGIVVVDRWPLDAPLDDRFGLLCRSSKIEDRLSALFDPRGVLGSAARWELP